MKSDLLMALSIVTVKQNHRGDVTKYILHTHVLHLKRL